MFLGDWNFWGAGSLTAPYSTPYMTPYMPQQVANSVSNTTTPSHYQTNLSNSEAYFLQSMQYQEFVQQYFNIMAAASGQPGFDCSHQVGFLK